jgi:hypothetical protein
LKAQQKQSRSFYKLAVETFTFALYAKRGLDSVDLEKKRAVVVKLGEKLEILDRAIQFIPNKYFIPRKEMNDKEKQAPDTVRTDFDKIKTPTNMQVSLSWLRGRGSNPRPGD